MECLTEKTWASAIERLASRRSPAGLADDGARRGDVEDVENGAEPATVQAARVRARSWRRSDAAKASRSTGLVGQGRRRRQLSQRLERSFMLGKERRAALASLLAGDR
jgi:hypothetical protein